MTRQLKARYPGPGGMLALSFGFHLVVFLLIARCQVLPSFHPDEAQVTYVDMVTLPVVSPQSGTPAPTALEAAPQLPAAAAPVAPPASMDLPAARTKAPGAAPKTDKPAAAPDEREFSERMAKLERQAGEKRQAEVLARLRNTGRVGMPGATGTEAGSDYSSYVQSRLKDAFSEVMTSQTKSPQVIAAISIGPDGRIDYQVEKHSGDQLFDDAVARAVTLAGRSLKAPPGGGKFRRVFRFRPEGVAVK